MRRSFLSSARIKWPCKTGPALSSLCETVDVLTVCDSFFGRLVTGIVLFASCLVNQSDDLVCSMPHCCLVHDCVDSHYVSRSTSFSSCAICFFHSKPNRKRSTRCCCVRVLHVLCSWEARYGRIRNEIDSLIRGACNNHVLVPQILFV